MKLVKKTTDRFPFALEELLNTDWLGGGAAVNKIGINVPAVNIKESDDSFLLQLAIPGFTKEAVAIELDKNTITISSEKGDSEANELKKYTRQEFDYTAFKRSFHLPKSVDQTAIEASYEAGILSITVPKKEEAKIQPKRNIAIV